MSTAIKVQGETYETADDLWASIQGLIAEVEEMPEGAPETVRLREHIEALSAELPEGYEPSDDPEPEEAGEEVTPEQEPEPEEVEPEITHDIQSAHETGADILCPLCGQDVPYPEAPPLNPDAQRCTACDGWGKYLNPTRVDGYVWAECSHCQGQGFTIGQSIAAPPVAAPLVALEPAWADSLKDPDTGRWIPKDPTPPWGNARWNANSGGWE